MLWTSFHFLELLVQCAELAQDRTASTCCVNSKKASRTAGWAAARVSVWSSPIRPRVSRWDLKAGFPQHNSSANLSNWAWS